jgi:peptide deformylase
VALLPILHHPDPRLRAVCPTVLRFDAALTHLAADLFETMYAAPGRGLAAPQVGVLARVFVIDTGWKTGTPAPMAFVNPRLLSVSDRRLTMEEGCLSIPGIPCPVERPAALRLHWQSPDATPHEAGFDGIEARAIQHELDHLDGILCIDRIAHPVGPDAP